MGMVVCPNHGRTGLLFVCPEVAEAVHEKTPCPGMQRLTHYGIDDPEELVQACWFCPACIAKLPSPGPVADPDGFLNAHSDLYRPMCPECFEEWRLMNDSELPVHWRFASGQAFAGLRELVRSFDFLRSADGHTYAGIEPDYLVKVIDGFLGESDGVVFGGDRANLNELRKALVEQIQPAYRQGLEAGRRRWQKGNRVYGSLSTEELHRLALELAPGDAMLRGWFAEGFCFAYSHEEMESLRSRCGD